MIGSPKYARIHVVAFISTKMINLTIGKVITISIDSRVLKSPPPLQTRSREIQNEGKIETKQE